MSIYIYIYIYRERERERKIDALNENEYGTVKNCLYYTKYGIHPTFLNAPVDDLWGAQGEKYQKL